MVIKTPLTDKKELVTSLRVDPALWKETRKTAIDCDITLGQAVDHALREWIAKQEKCKK